jgi:hypothetical protein
MKAKSNKRISYE